MVRRISSVVLLCVLAVSLRADSPAADLAAHGHWKRLKALIEPRAAASPNDAEVQWLLARVRAAYRDFDGALAPAEKATALDAKNADYRWQLALVVGELASRASVFKQIGLAKRYKREVEAALAINPQHTDALTGLMEFYNRAPGIIGGDKKKAAELADRITAINKVDGCIAKASLLGQQSPVPIAELEQVWVQAVQADPQRYEPHVTLAGLYAGGVSPRWELAEKEALAARHLDPDRVAPYGLLGSVYAVQDRWSDLDAILVEAEKRIPDNLSPFLRVAGTLANTGKELARAERYARKYLSQDPEPTASSHAVARWRLGLILEKQGRKADAMAELETAARLDPKFEPAQKDLKRLKAGS